jgi:hypothetical protein
MEVVVVGHLGAAAAAAAALTAMTVAMVILEQMLQPVEVEVVVLPVRARLAA